MSLIKQIEDLRASGRSDSQIVSDLRGQGFMPREIEDALSQFQVKSAVSQEFSSPSDPSMQQSILSQPPAPISSQSQPVQDFGSPSPVQSSQQDYYDSQSWPDQQYSYSYQPASSETISEIAEQIFDQKIVKIKSELSKIDDFRSDIDGKIGLLKDRLKRIEGIIDTLQDSIIKKIGEYGENIQDLGNDLKATQESFSKVVNPLVEGSKASTTRTLRVSRSRKKKR